MVALTVLVGKTSVDVGVGDAALLESGVTALITCDELFDNGVELGPVKEDTDPATMRNGAHARRNRIKVLVQSN